MAADYVDLRAKVTPETDAVLSAEEHFEGCDRSELVRRILHAWAVKRIEAATVLRDLLADQGISGSAGAARGTTPKRDAR